jgi:hypothetical protein
MYPAPRRYDFQSGFSGGERDETSPFAKSPKLSEYILIFLLFFPTA